MPAVLRIFLKGLHQLSIVLVFLLFVSVGLLTITGQGFYAILTKPATYIELITEIQVADRGKGLLADFLVTYSMSGGQLTSIETIPLASWETAAETMLPLEWLNDNLQTAMQTSLSWVLEGQGLLPDFTLDLAPIQTVLDGPQGILAVLPLLQSVQPCPPGIETITYLSEAGIISCLPDNRDVTEIARLIATFTSDTLPEEISLLNLYKEGLIQPTTIQTLGQVQSSVQVTEQGIRLGFRLLAALMTLYLLLQALNANKLLASLRWPVFTLGLLCLIAAAGFFGFLEFGLDATLAAMMPSLDADTLALLADTGRFVGFPIIGQLILWAAGVLILGGLIHLCALILTRLNLKSSQSLQPDTPERRRVRRQFR